MALTLPLLEGVREAKYSHGAEQGYTPKNDTAYSKEGLHWSHSLGPILTRSSPPCKTYLLHINERSMPKQARKTRNGSNLVNSSHLDQEPDPNELLDTAQVAKLWGVSRATVDRERVAGSLAGILRGHSYVYRRDQATEVGALRRTAAGADKEQRDGERDARVFAAFREGLTIDAAVVREKVAIVIVARLYEAWGKARTEAQSGIECMHRIDETPCGGLPQPHNMLCDFHAGLSRIVSAEERLLLDGKDIPTALRCQTCSAVTSHGVCARCLSKVRIDVEGDGPGLRLVVRIQERIIAIVSSQRSLEMAKQILESLGAPPVAQKAPIVSAEEKIPEGKALGELLKSLEQKMAPDSP